MNFKNMAEQRLAQIKEQRNALVENWSPFINAVDGFRTKQSKANLSLYDKYNMAVCLENAFLEGGLKGQSKLFETTYSDNVEFLGIFNLGASSQECEVQQAA